MLKIGTVKWQAKCSKHPKYDPASDGPPGNCSRCRDLMTIFDQHRRTLQLMRTFTPPRRQRVIDPIRERQQSLFA